jgi:hypothetical protein
MDFRTFLLKNDRIDTDRAGLQNLDPFNPRSPKRFGKNSNAANVKCKKIYPIGPPSGTRSMLTF